ncbi:MAG: methyltransferase domain-containing protein [Halieaceae bacterium]|jgi:SAM-dependent methyltransferase|nr:methyltransferase domain-containing protein [Halieaceae bacterium]
MSLYERYLLPHLINCACATRPIMKQRAKVVPRARGTVLEIGIGTGLNLAYYDAARVDRIIGLDPSERSWKLASERAASVPIPLEFIGLPGEEIPLADGSVDTIVVTFSLCTIPDPVRALEGMRRVLRSGGELLFCEHGLAPDQNVQRWQDRLDGIWSRLAGGCHLNRNIPELFDRGGFRVSDMETRYLPGTPRVAAFNYWGSARIA